MHMATKMCHIVYLGKIKTDPGDLQSYSNKLNLRIQLVILYAFFPNPTENSDVKYFKPACLREP